MRGNGAAADKYRGIPQCPVVKVTTRSLPTLTHIVPALLILLLFILSSCQTLVDVQPSTDSTDWLPPESTVIVRAKVRENRALVRGIMGVLGWDSSVLSALGNRLDTVALGLEGWKPGDNAATGGLSSVLDSTMHAVLLGRWPVGLVNTAMNQWEKTGKQRWNNGSGLEVMLYNPSVLLVSRNRLEQILDRMSSGSLNPVLDMSQTERGAIDAGLWFVQGGDVLDMFAMPQVLSLPELKHVYAGLSRQDGAFYRGAVNILPKDPAVAGSLGFVLRLALAGIFAQMKSERGRELLASTQIENRDGLLTLNVSNLHSSELEQVMARFSRGMASRLNTP